jgi:hypothetical protein
MNLPTWTLERVSEGRWDAVFAGPGESVGKLTLPPFSDRGRALVHRLVATGESIAATYDESGRVTLTLLTLSDGVFVSMASGADLDSALAALALRAIGGAA